MSPRESLDTYLADAFARGGESSDHPADDALIDYQAGRLAETDAETVAEHLSRCTECSRFVLASQAFSGHAEELPDVAPHDVAADWQALQQRMEAESAAPRAEARERSAGHTVADAPEVLAFPSSLTASGKGPWWTSSALGFGVAATLLFVVLGLQVTRHRDASRLAELEAWKADSERWTSGLAVHSIEPWGSTRAPGDAPEVQAGDVVLLYVGPDVGAAEGKEFGTLEITDVSGVVVQRIDGLVVAQEGLMTLRLPQEGLLPGTYRLTLRREAGEEAGVEYKLQVVPGVP